jgi:hypothetical protein
VIVLLDWMSNEAVMNSANSSVYTSPAIASRRVTADQEQRLRKAFRFVCVLTSHSLLTLVISDGRLIL